MEFQYLAIGRLAYDDGEFIAGKHVIIASAGQGSDSTYREQVVNLMDQGGKKLLERTKDNVTRLKAQDSSLWVSFYEKDDLLLGFFAVSELLQAQNTDQQQKNKARSIDTGKKITELKKRFISDNNVRDLLNAKEKGGVHKSNSSLLSSYLPEWEDKLQNAMGKVEAVKNQTRQNMDVMLANEVKLDDLGVKAEKLEDRAQAFKKNARTVHRQMWWQNCRMNIMIGGGILFVILIIVISVVASQ